MLILPISSFPPLSTLTPAPDRLPRPPPERILFELRLGMEWSQLLCVEPRMRSMFPDSRANFNGFSRSDDDLVVGGE